MSETADPPKKAYDFALSLSAVLVQLILVPLASFIFTLPIGAVLESSGEYPADIHHPIARIGMPPISLVTGYFLGLCARHFVPVLARNGAWAWMLSTLLFIAAFLLDAKHASFSSVFASRFDVEGSEGLGVWLIGLPTFFSIGYSIACLLSRSKAD